MMVSKLTIFESCLEGQCHQWTCDRVRGDCPLAYPARQAEGRAIT